MADQDELRIKGYLISPELFTTGYPAGAGPCTCDASCCGRGAYVDLSERARILEHAALIKPHLDATQPHDESAWFEQEERVDPDYASGKCIGTAVHGDKCALLDGQGRCSLQVAANAAGMHRWALKPLYCLLFPIEIANGVIRFDPYKQGQRACCSVQSTFEVPLFEACRAELVHVLGEDGFESLRQHYAARRRARSLAISSPPV
jgi:hypothetical protein